ncbi:MAG: HsdM family class I SAM-dependent methyltransferase [Candidatus Iainarchaeum sp.]
MEKYKEFGQVFTPKWIVKEILDLVEFTENNLLNKKIIDPACGDGAFLIEVVSRTLDTLIKNNFSNNEIIRYLEEHIYGIEIDRIEFEKCIQNLNSIVNTKLNKSQKINWKILCDDTLDKYKDFIGIFDFVIGNPPYIRIHNLDKETREKLKYEFEFCNGTIDIYIAFFELGFKLLNNKGVLGYITPNSYLHNTSYSNFREYLKGKKALETLVDFKANKLFKGFSTYTAITIISFSTSRTNFIYKELKDGKIKEINQISYLELNKKDWSFSGKDDMLFLDNIYSNNGAKVSDYFDVQYGFATLRDKIFIGNITDENKSLVLFNESWIEKKILYKIVKGSTYKGTDNEIKYVIFPYEKYGERFIPIPENKLKLEYPNTHKYLLKNKDELLKRDIDKGASWYEFGRSQGVQTSFNEKIVLSTLVNHKIHFYKLNKDIFVYSGIFIIKKNPDVNWKIITDILDSSDFYKYIQITGKDFSGGYKSVTSNQIKNYPINKKILTL